MAADMAGVTSNLRFSGPNATDLRQMTVNLVPYPRIHFCLSGVAPLRRNPSSLEALSVPEITTRLFDWKNMMFTVESQEELRLLTSIVTYRGAAISSIESETALVDIYTSQPKLFMPWFPSRFKQTICEVP